MSTESEDIARASRARAILNDPLVVDVLQAMRDGIVSAFFSTPAEAAELRERLHMMDRARQHFEGAFRALIAGGDIANAERNAEGMAERALAEIQRLVRER